MSDLDFKDTIRAIIFSLLLILFGQTPLINPLREATTAVVNPLQYGFYTVGTAVRVQWEFVTNLKSLPEINFKLEQELKDLQSQLSHLNEIKRENELLKEQLGVEASKEKQLVKGEVIGYGRTQSIVKLNAPSKANIKKGAAVIYKNFLIGEVIEVQSSSCFVRLITDVDSKIAALDQDSPNRARGILRGQYATLMIMEKIFSEEEVTVGDVIITSGEDGKFPKGLVLGYVTEVFGGEESLLKGAKVAPGVDLTRLEEVFIIL